MTRRTEIDNSLPANKWSLESKYSAELEKDLVNSRLIINTLEHKINQNYSKQISLHKEISNLKDTLKKENKLIQLARRVSWTN